MPLRILAALLVAASASASEPIPAGAGSFTLAPDANQMGNGVDAAGKPTGPAT